MRVMQTYDVLGVPITVTSPQHACSTILGWANDTQGRFVCVRDVASLMAIVESPAIAELHNYAAMITPDGAPIALIGKLRGYAVQRTCGPDLIDLVCEQSVPAGISHFFFGGKEGVARDLAKRFTIKYPGLRVAGYECPPFGEMDEQELLETRERIRASGAHILWVGMSSPKQDIWMYENFRYLPVTQIGVGAAFDFHTGAVKRAPRWMQKHMLEWAYRLASEPRRLWRRYLILAPRFVWRVLRSSAGAR
jgi:N-acetylglucosaminyldiphosphoundecaprenol N-acetyl-beta-D-mannosaminyltransferase